MARRNRISRTVTAGGLAAVVAMALVPGAVANPGSQDCGAWRAEYVLSANLRLADTPMGAGDGVYAIGPGKVVLRFDDKSDRVQMLSYAMRDHFVVTSKLLFWKTTVTTDTRTRVTPDACGVAAKGVLADHALGWTTRVRGYRTDGTLTCDGSMCGKFGAPPPGKSPLHLGPSDVQFQPFKFSGDMKTFTMSETLVSRSSMPKQTAYVTLSGRQVSRTCAPAPACP